MTVIQITMAIFYVLVLIYVSWTDIQTRRIPNVVIFPAILIALLTLPWTAGIKAGLMGGLIAPLPLVIARVVAGADKMGMGDIKLAIFIGLVLGHEPALMGLMIGLVLSFLVSYAAISYGLYTWQTRIPLGPYLAVATIPLVLLPQLPLTLMATFIP